MRFYISSGARFKQLWGAACKEKEYFLLKSVDKSSEKEAALQNWSIHEKGKHNLSWKTNCLRSGFKLFFSKNILFLISSTHPNFVKGHSIIGRFWNTIYFVSLILGLTFSNIAWRYLFYVPVLRIIVLFFCVKFQIKIHKKCWKLYLIPTCTTQEHCPHIFLIFFILPSPS